MSLVLMALAAMAQTAAPVAAPAAEDPAAVQISGFCTVLEETMKHGASLGVAGREAKLRPEVVKLFNIPVMAQFVVGPRWQTMSAAEKQSIIGALERYTVRTYARNFDSYSGEVFKVDPHPPAHGLDKLVKTTVISPKAAPVSLGYRMRESNGAWKVIDVYYNAVSQVTAQRADFESTLASGGAAALVQKLDSQTKSLH